MKTLITLVLILFMGTIALAQPPAPTATPIDGGLGLLLASGLALGFRKLFQKNREL